MIFIIGEEENSFPFLCPVQLMSNTVLYIHGMGGGADSRIPSILREELGDYGVTVIARTYDFDPEIASLQITGWVSELSPDLIIGESLGALHALRIEGLPVLFVSPALNAAFYFEALAWLVLFPGVTWIFDRIYRPREGDRQKLHFTFNVLRKYRNHRRLALGSVHENEQCFAFFGRHDHYMRSGIVRINTWKKYFGYAYALYDGTHFMEEEYVRSMLTQKVMEVLKISL